MKILITGYHGFVGQNLIPYLKGQGHEVFGLGRDGTVVEGLAQAFTWNDLDTENRKLATENFDAIIHLAGKAHDTKNQTEADVYFKVNRDLTVKAYNFFLRHPEIKTFIFFSSVKAAADKVMGEKLTESVMRTPKGPYGESKAEAEKEILSHLPDDDNLSSASPLPEGEGLGVRLGRKVYILRPCMMHGPGNKGNLNLLYKVVKTGLPWPLGSFENKRSFASIKNVCYVVGRLLTDNVSSGIYNIADDEALSTNELIDVICKALGKKTHILRFGRGAMTAMAHLGTKLHLPLNDERLAKLTENYVVDNTKIKQALHIDQMPVSTREGLTYTIESFDK